MSKFEGEATPDKFYPDTNYGLGKHVWMLDPAMVPLYLRVCAID